MLTVNSLNIVLNSQLQFTCSDVQINCNLDRQKRNRNIYLLLDTKLTHKICLDLLMYLVQQLVMNKNSYLISYLVRSDVIKWYWIKDLQSKPLVILVIQEPSRHTIWPAVTFTNHVVLSLSSVKAQTKWALQSYIVFFPDESTTL